MAKRKNIPADNLPDDPNTYNIDEETGEISPKMERTAVDYIPDVKGHHIQLQFDIRYHGTKKVIIEGESQTVPDLNLSVRQLLLNHSRNEPTTAKVREPVYLDQEIPTISDITDLEEYKEQLERRKQEVEEAIKADKDKAEKDRLQKEAEAKDKKQLEEDAKRGRQLRVDTEAEKAATKKTSK